jgi:DNA polymerase-3 subunit delta'
MPFADIIGHDRAKALLQAAVARDRLAHAYLFHGVDRIGKRLLATRLAQALLCDGGPGSTAVDGCGVCRSCRQIDAQTHPDFTYIRPDPEQANPQIKIEQIRDIEHQLIYRPLIGDRKICMIDEADRMTIGAANALLKTLEEPPDHSVFLLISSRPSALPATIRSRCQVLRLTPPARTQIEAAVVLRRNLPPADARFLAILSEGQLGRALETDVGEEKLRHSEYATSLTPAALGSIGTLLTTAETMAKTDRAGEALSWLQRWLRDRLIEAVSGTSDDILDQDHEDGPAASAAVVNVDALIELLEDIDQLDRQGHRHLNLQMALEHILLRVRTLCIPFPPAVSPRTQSRS